MGDMQEAGVLLRVTVDAVLPDGLHMAESPVYIYIGQNSTDDFHYRVKTTRIVYTFSPTADLTSVSLESFSFLLMILSRILPFLDCFSRDPCELNRQTGCA